MESKEKLGAIDEESSWEDSSVIRENVNSSKITPVGWPIIIVNLSLPLIWMFTMATFAKRTPFFDFFVWNIMFWVIYPALIIKLIPSLIKSFTRNNESSSWQCLGHMDGVWNRVKNISLIERNSGKAVGFISFFLWMIIVPMWSLAPQLQLLKPENDNLEKKHQYSILLVIELALGSLFFMFVSPILQNLYWTVYVYECFGYSIRLGVLKWIISLWYGLCFYFLFNYIDGPIVGIIAVVFFVIYARILLWMRKVFGKAKHIIL